MEPLRREERTGVKGDTAKRCPEVAKRINGRGRVGGRGKVAIYASDSGEPGVSRSNEEREREDTRMRY